MALRPVQHPDLSNLLTHFTSRARPTGPGAQPWIRNLSPQDRLNSILSNELLIPAQTYSGGHPAICLTESTGAGLAYLIGAMGYAPWGLVMNREWVWAACGGPVWYYRPEYKPAVDNLPDDLRTWAVRLDDNPQSPSDWLHEREWRIPRPNGYTLNLDAAAVVAVIVGDSSWKPDGEAIEDEDGDFLGFRPSQCWEKAQRWIWTGAGFNYMTP